MAGKGQLAAIADAHLVHVTDEITILENTAMRHVIDDFRRTGCKAQNIAVAHLRHLRNTGLFGQFLLRHQMRRLAMDGHDDLRLRPFIHPQKLVAARMAGHMHQSLIVRDNVHALFDQAVLDLDDRLFVAGNGA